MAPWQLEEFMAEKVERARRLLAEPGEQQGSADLQARAGALGGGCGRPGGTLVRGGERRLSCWPLLACGPHFKCGQSLESSCSGL